MDGRIGSLHVRYRVARDRPGPAVVLSALDRALKARIADVVTTRLSSFELGERVVVIRDARLRLTVRTSDPALETSFIDQLGAAAQQAVAALLASPGSPESIMRFADQGEFLAAFIIDLMDGCAADRWYFGAFRRYSGDDVRATITAALTDHPAHVARTFGWLQRRAQLARLLTLLGARSALAFMTQPASEAAQRQTIPDELSPLVAAARQLWRAVFGLQLESAEEAALVAAYRSTAPPPTTWMDRHALSAWVAGLVRFVWNGVPAHASTRPEDSSEAFERLLNGPLDWLDAAWLRAELTSPPARADATRAPVRPGRRVLATRQEHAIEKLAELVRRGTVRLDPHDQRAALIVRMLAELSVDGTAATMPERTLVDALERVVDAWLSIHARGAGERPDLLRGLDTALPSDAHAPAEHGLEHSLAPVRALGRAPMMLLRRLIETSIADEHDPAVLSAGAGLFLLTRALQDVQLAALARAAGVPFEHLRSALAIQLLGLPQPFDAATALWAGASEVDLARLREGDLEALQRTLFERLAQQRRLDPSEAAWHELDCRGTSFQILSDRHGTCWPLSAPAAEGTAQRLLARWQEATDVVPASVSAKRNPAEDIAGLTALGSCPPGVELLISSIASLLLRAWSSWLPGVAGSSMLFLVKNCLGRRGRVRMSELGIEVQLEPAPLDVVLEMAGYLRPIEAVAWLDRRSVRFTIVPSSQR